MANQKRKAEELAYSFALRNYLTGPLLVSDLVCLIENAMKHNDFEINELKRELERKVKWAKAWKRLAKLWKK